MDTLHSRLCSIRVPLTGHPMFHGFSFHSAPVPMISPTSLAESLFGTLLVLPSQIPASPENEIPLNCFLNYHNHYLEPPLPNPVVNLPPTFLLLSSKLNLFCQSIPCTPLPLAPSSSGLFKVLCRAPHFFLLQLGPHTEKASVHGLKPAILPPNTLPALPPSTGQPPSSLPPFYSSPKHILKTNVSLSSIRCSLITFQLQSTHLPSCFFRFPAFLKKFGWNLL